MSKTSKTSKMLGGCVETSLMLILLVLICVVIGFLIGSYYEKHLQTQNKEHFASLSKGEISGIVIGSVVLLILVLVIILYIIMSQYAKFFTNVKSY